MLRSCPNVDQSWISDVGDDWCWSVMTGVFSHDWQWDGVQMDFGFSFDAVPTIDMVLYFRG